MTLRGMYGGAGAAGLSRKAGFDRWVGKPSDCVSDGLARDSWTNCISGADGAAAGGWAKFSGFKAVSVPLCTQADNGGYDLAGASTGAYDAKYRSLCTTIANRNVGNLILRPGWEFNGGWYPWGASSPATNWVASPTRAAQFAAAFRRFVGIARPLLPGVLIDWNSSFGMLGVPTQNFYPGDDVVDIIGMDVYNTIDPDQPTWTDAQRWNYFLTSTNGLNWLASFSAQHKKPISLPEWGTGYKKATSGTANVSRDSGPWITSMAAWIAAHNVFYANYFHYPAPDGQWQLGADVPLWTLVPGTQNAAKQFPNASAAYLAAYGVTTMPAQIDTDYTALGNAIAAEEAAAAAVTTATTSLSQAQAALAAAKTNVVTAAQAVLADAQAL